MSSISVTGHDINVASMRELIPVLTAHGNKYAPSNPLIKLAALTANLADAEAALANLETAEKTHKIEAAKRRNVFETEAPTTKSTRVFAAFKTSGAIPEIVKQAAAVQKKIQGSSKPKKEKEETQDGSPAPKDISTSQRSMNDIISHWTEMITLAEQTTEYQPAEADITVAALKTMLTKIKAANDACNAPYAAYLNALNSRDEILYNEQIGLYARSMLAKAYVAQVFGFNSPQAKQARSFEFKKLKK